jgi:uncharacterized membrane-anchored protein
MTRMRNALVAVGLAAVLGGVNWAIAGKERTLESGRVVMLELAPVDPRSLMQGDYMALNFAAGAKLLAAKGRDTVPADGEIVVKLDARSVGTFDRLREGGETLGADEVAIRYRLRKRGVRVGTDAFYFEEGTGNRYGKARFGEMRVAASGESLLVALRDKDLQVLGGK